MSILAEDNVKDINTIHFKSANNFTGVIRYYNLDGSYNTGWHYANGKIDGTFSASSLAKLGVASTEGICGVNPIYGKICAGDEKQEYCDTEIIGMINVECRFGTPDDGGGNGGGGDGGFSPGGGNGSTNNPSTNADNNIEVKQDSLQKHYPCLTREVLGKLLGNSMYSKLLQPFQTIQLPNGNNFVIQGLPNLTWGFSEQVYGGTSNDYMLGNTDSQGTSSKINFNSLAITNASELFLQMVAIHEAGHAYVNYYIKTGSYGNPIDTARYSTWAMDIVNFESVVRSERAGGNFNDHSLFLENYVDNFVKILKDVNGSAYTDKQYQMAAIYGLNNAGPRTYNPFGGGFDLYAIYKNKLEKSYNNLMVKYGIIAADRDAFYLQNLLNVPANKKLPTNCN